MKWLSWIPYINSLNWSILQWCMQCLYIYIMIYIYIHIWTKYGQDAGKSIVQQFPQRPRRKNTVWHGMEEAQIWEQSAFPAGIPKISKDLQLRSHWECVLWQWQAESHPSSHCQLPPSWHTQDVTDQPPVANGRFFLVQPRCMVRNPLLGASDRVRVSSSWQLGSNSLNSSSSCSCGDFFQDIPPNPESHSEPN